MQDHPRPDSWLRYFLQVLFTATVYFILARLSLLLQYDHSNATPVWPPAGFAFAIILLWGNRMAPGILFGAFAVNFVVFVSERTVDYPQAALLSLIIGIGNMSEALMGKYLLQKMIPRFSVDTFLTTLRHIFTFTIAAGVMCLVSSIIGSTTVLLGNVIAVSHYPMVWLTWWLGDFSGVILFGTLILVWVNYLKNANRTPNIYKERTIESIILFLCVVLFSGVIFNNWVWPHPPFVYGFWIIPVFVWSALRLQKHHTVTAIAICSVMAILGTVDHRGMFGELPLNEALISLQAFICIMLLSKLAMNVNVIQRRNTEAALRETSAELEQRVKNRTAQLGERNQFVETILNSSFDAIIVLDHEMRCISINKIAKSHLRLPYPESVVGQKISDIPLFLLPAEAREDIANALKGHTIHREKFASPVSEKYFEVDYIPLKNGDEVYAVMIVAHDITQRIHTEQELMEQKALAEMLVETLEKRNKDLQKTNEELSSFAYVASHDLQEPLRKIQIFSKRITDSEFEVLSDTAKDYFNRMKSAAERMQNLIEDLLTYSRTGSMERTLQKIHLKDLVEEVKEDLKDNISQKSVTIEANDLCECSVIPFQFRQLLSNLISNSIKFSKPDVPPRIEIKSTIAKGSELGETELDPDKEYCHVHVSDNGIGFDPEFNEQIFGLFQRLHGKNEYPGTGIGLSIVKKIIENHYGIIKANGEKGKGAEFDIYLPNEHVPA